MRFKMKGRAKPGSPRCRTTVLDPGPRSCLDRRDYGRYGIYDLPAVDTSRANRSGEIVSKLHRILCTSFGKLRAFLFPAAI